MTSSPLSLQTRHERYNEDKISPASPNQQRIDQATPRGAQIEVGRDQTIEMNVVSLNPQKSLADQKWVPAQLRIFLDESGVFHTYRLTICRGNSLLTDHISKNTPALHIKVRVNNRAVQPTSTKIVPNYAFNIQPPAIWFDTLDENFPLCFSPKDPSNTGVRGMMLITRKPSLTLTDGLLDLVQLQDYFMVGNKASHFA